MLSKSKMFSDIVLLLNHIRSLAIKRSAIINTINIIGTIITETPVANFFNTDASDLDTLNTLMADHIFQTNRKIGEAILVLEQDSIYNYCSYK